MVTDLLALSTSTGLAAQGHKALTGGHGVVGVRAKARLTLYISAGSIHCSPVESSPVPVSGLSTTIVDMSSNWIIEVALPRGFPETPPPPTRGPTQATSRCVLA